MTAKARLWELVENVARSVTDPITGRFENKTFAEALRTKLTADDVAPNIRAATFDEVVSRLATGFAARRSPKAGHASTMFSPGAVLRLSRGQRVWMEHAGEADLIEWGSQSTRNRENAVRADRIRQEYVAQRVDALTSHPGWALGRVERELFGFVEMDTPFDEDDDPGWEDAA